VVFFRVREMLSSSRHVNTVSICLSAEDNTVNAVCLNTGSQLSIRYSVTAYFNSLKQHSFIATERLQHSSLNTPDIENMARQKDIYI
jgi:hypothetical protein